MDDSGARPLTEQVLPELPATVSVPTYRRADLARALVHISVGGFNRSHLLSYLDDLAMAGARTAWAECGIGIRGEDSWMRDALLPQQGLYTLVTRSAEQDTARVIGALTRYIFAPDDPEAALRALADRQTRIISLTVTEGGYYIDPAMGAFMAEHPDVQHDLGYDRHQPEAPRTAFWYLCEALDRRRAQGAAVTVLSCDNLPHNGAVARLATLSYARLRDEKLARPRAEELARWIEDENHVTFPNSMVDRITPRTEPADRALVAEALGGILDAAPVMCEPFRQWVIEDRFAAGRPPLEDLKDPNVLLTGDVAPYELAKLRLLNGGHSALAYLARLLDITFVHQAATDAQLRPFLRRLMHREVAPLLQSPPGLDLAQYQQTLLERFANPKIQDQVARLCENGSAKLPLFVLPSLRAALATDPPRPHALLTLVVASWFRYLQGTDDQGGPITIEEMKDPLAATLRALAAQGREDPRPLLELHHLFDDLAENTAFVAELQRALSQLGASGVRATLRAYGFAPS